MPLAVGRRRSRERIGQAERLKTRLAGEPLVGGVDEEDDRELESLRFVHGEHVHLLARRLEVSRHRIVPRLAQQLEVRHEEGGAVGRQRARR